MKIAKVIPLTGYRVAVFFDNGRAVTVDMNAKLRTVRFSGLRDLQTFNAVTTDGKSIHWPRGVSMAVSEIIEMTAND